MKKFEWMFTQKLGTENKVFSILENVGDGTFLFWGILRPVSNGLYDCFMFNKDRNGYITLSESLSLDGAKGAIEKNLFDMGIIKDGDILEDHTE